MDDIIINRSNCYFNSKGELAPNKDILVAFFSRNMLNKTITMFKYRDLPDSLPERELEMILQLRGFGIVTEHDGNLVALWGGFQPPHDVYYRPRFVRVDNPWAKINRAYEIDKECVLVRNDPLNRGLVPILTHYSEQLTEVDITKLLSLINFRAMYGITANTDSEYESAKEFLKQLSEGRQGAIRGEEMNGKVETQPYSNNSSNYLTQVIEMEQYIKGSFYQEIGLQSTFNMKRERLSEAESGMDTDCLRPLIDSMLEERQKAVKKINEMYGTNISVEFNSSWSKYNEEDELIVGDEEITEEEATEEQEEVVVTEDVAEAVLEKLVDLVVDEPEEEKETEDENIRSDAEPTD